MNICLSKIILFIPCYNCDKQILRVIDQLESNDNYKYFNEILLIDNRSQDSTVKKSVDKLIDINIDNIKVLRNSENVGLGGTHKVAFNYAKQNNASHVAVLHGDDQGSITDLINILNNKDHEHYDCCLGSRFNRHSKAIGYSKFRIFGNWVFNSIFSFAAGKIITDLGAGLNIYKVSAISDERITKFANDLTFNCYMLLFSISQKQSIKFFPITWREDDQISNVRLFSQAIKTFRIALGYFIRGSKSLDCIQNTTDFSSLRLEEYYPGETINLVIPMAGRGSRFSNAGYEIPKPLVDLNGRPFFWWAIMSVKRTLNLKTLTCVILKEHIEQYDIKNIVLSYFPEATFQVLDDVTDGALDSAIYGLNEINNNYPVLINDCDHAFEGNDLSSKLELLRNDKNLNAYLCHFKSSSAAYSYAEYDETGKLIKTAEKKVISNLAIAGAYIFENKNIIVDYFEEYKNNCVYSETYISGLYNLMLDAGKVVNGIVLDSHLSFGTPEELEKAIFSKQYIEWLSKNA